MGRVAGLRVGHNSASELAGKSREKGDEAIAVMAGEDAFGFQIVLK